MQVSKVKEHIEQQQGANFPAASLVVIHQGKVSPLSLSPDRPFSSHRTQSESSVQVLKDGTTLADNKVGENGFLVVMVQKVKQLQSCLVTVRRV